MISTMHEPQSQAPVILNNTPLVALHSIGQLRLLRELYTEVLIPTAVQYEFLAVESKDRQLALDEAPWIKTEALADQRHALVYIGLDRGEAEVLALAVELKARLVVIDERKGRHYANRLGISLTGTIGVLLAAKEKGLITAIFPSIEQLFNKGLYLSPTVVERALEIAGESVS